MKNILFPTDFSRHADNALRCAIEIANRFGSTIHLLHTFKVSNRAGMLISVEAHILDDAQFAMSQCVERFSGFLANGAHFQTHILRGDTAPTIGRMSQEENFDLVVMGTQGASGLQEIFMGSTTSAVINQTNIPVLAIPTQCTLRELDTIVFAIDDSDISSAQVVAPLTKLAKAFGAKVLVFHLEKGEKDSGIDPSIEIFLDGTDHSFHYDLAPGEPINQSIGKFMLDYRGDLLCMIRRDRGFLGNLFHQSVTRREVFHSNAPILILSDRS